MTEKIKHNQFLVAVFDEEGQIAAALIKKFSPANVLLFKKEIWARDKELCFAEDIIMTELIDRNTTEAEYLKSVKNLFFCRSQHVVINIRSFESLSILTRGIRALLNSEIFTLTVVTASDLEPFIRMGDNSEQMTLAALKSQKRFFAMATFSINDFMTNIHSQHNQHKSDDFNISCD